MKCFLRCIFCLVFASVPLGIAQIQPRQATNSGPAVVPADQEQILNYWTAEGGWHSELQLRNNLPSEDLTVTPVLRSADGNEISLPRVTMKPQAVRTINLSSAIDTSAPELANKYGSVVLRYHSAAQRNLYAAMMLHDTGHPIAFHIDAMGESADYDSGSREGIWWLPSASTRDILVLTNQGKERMEVDVALYDASGKDMRQQIALGPRQTERLSVRQLVAKGGLTGEYGGIRIQARTHGGSLDTLHAIYDEDAGFSALLKMFDHDPGAKMEARDFNRTGKWTYRAPMLALTSPDPALNFPSETVLHPQVFLRNTGGRSMKVNLRLNWRSEDATGKTAAPDVVLKPFETRLVDVSQLQAGMQIPKDAHWASVILTSDGPPDELIAVSASYDQTLRYGAQTPFSDQLSSKWKGGQWEYDLMHDSIITAGNGGTTPIRAAFTVYYNDGQQKYELEQTLEPDEQMWMDIGKLIKEQVPGKDGKLLPVTLTTGSYEFRDLTHPGIGMLFEGKVIYDKSYGHAMYGCAACCAAAVGAVYVQYNPFYNPIGPGYTNGVYEHDDCGDVDDISSDFYNWNTANHAIATTTIYGTHTGVSVGNTTSSTTGYVVHTNGRNGCYEIPGSASGPTDVNAPSITSISPSKLPVGGSGVQVTISGTGFGPSAGLNLPSGVTSSGQHTSDTQITVTLTAGYSSTIGNANISVTISGQQSNTKQLILNGPASATVISDISAQNLEGTIIRQVTYQVKNFDGSVVGNIPVAETFSTSNWSCTNATQPATDTTSCDGTTSTTSGLFTDSWSDYGTFYTPAGCGVNVIDHWQWCSPSGPSPGKTFMTLTGFIHTIQSEINGYTSPPGEIPAGTVFNP